MAQRQLIEQLAIGGGVAGQEPVEQAMACVGRRVLCGPQRFCLCPRPCMDATQRVCVDHLVQPAQGRRQQQGQHQPHPPHQRDACRQVLHQHAPRHAAGGKSAADWPMAVRVAHFKQKKRRQTGGSNEKKGARGYFTGTASTTR